MPTCDMPGPFTVSELRLSLAMSDSTLVLRRSSGSRDPDKHTSRPTAEACCAISGGIVSSGCRTHRPMMTIVTPWPFCCDAWEKISGFRPSSWMTLHIFFYIMLFIRAPSTDSGLMMGIDVLPLTARVVMPPHLTRMATSPHQNRKVVVFAWSQLSKITSELIRPILPCLAGRFSEMVLDSARSGKWRRISA